MSLRRLRRAPALLALLAFPLVGCQTFVDATGEQPGDGAGDGGGGSDDVETEVPSGSDDKNDAPGWSTQPSLHLGERRFGAVDVGGRQLHPMWVAGSAERPVPLTITVDGQDGAAVRVAVLGPLEGGTRAVLGSDGYLEPVTTAEVTIAAEDAAQLLVVVGSYRLGGFAAYEVSVRCADGADEDCGPADVDALSTPRVGGLAGALLDDGSALIAAELNHALATRDMFEVELWTSPPGARWFATPRGVSVSSGNQVNFLLAPGAIAEGDDLMLVVREGDGLPSGDRGVWARFAPVPRAFARLDAILYSDLGAVTISGVTGYTEARDTIALRRAATGEELVSATAVAALPGTTGMGFGAFEVTLFPEIFLEDGGVNPKLPKNGEILSVGRVRGDGSYEAFGCFEYCNDLAGTGACTAAPRACP